jgi:muramoyltetrapeptide carboxypeptidase
MPLLKPKRIKRGDLIGVVAPASPALDRSRIHQGIHYLEGLGYHVLPGKHLEAATGFLAGSDAQRAQDLNDMIRNPRVRAIIGLRGGYGSPRILPLVDYAALRRDPKVLVGFSDLTALQLAIWRRIGLVTFSGPMVAVEFAAGIDPFTEEHFWQLITCTRKPGILTLPPDTQLHCWKPGLSQGTLIPANLAMLCSLLGTRFFPDLKGAVLALEDVGEQLHRIDRLFNQLTLAGATHKLAALLLGQFTHCTTSRPEYGPVTIEDVLRDHVQPVPGPVLANFPYGHIPRRLTLPVGVPIRVSALRQPAIQFLEAAVTA